MVTFQRCCLWSSWSFLCVFYYIVYNTVLNPSPWPASPSCGDVSQFISCCSIEMCHGLTPPISASRILEFSSTTLEEEASHIFSFLLGFDPILTASLSPIPSSHCMTVIRSQPLSATQSLTCLWPAVWKRRGETCTFAHPVWHLWIPKSRAVLPVLMGVQVLWKAKGVSPSNFWMSDWS